MVHVGCTRCATSSTENKTKKARITVLHGSMSLDRFYAMCVHATTSMTTTNGSFFFFRCDVRQTRSQRHAMQRKDPANMVKVSPSLSETHSLLSQLVPILDAGSKEYAVAVDVAGVVSTLARRAEQLQQQVKHQKVKHRGRKN